MVTPEYCRVAMVSENLTLCAECDKEMFTSKGKGTSTGLDRYCNRCLSDKLVENHSLEISALNCVQRAIDRSDDNKKYLF